jgi:ribosomal protein S18 acetylase RimI-like enzyme
VRSVSPAAAGNLPFRFLESADAAGFCRILTRSFPGNGFPGRRLFEAGRPSALLSARRALRIFPALGAFAADELVGVVWIRTGRPVQSATNPDPAEGASRGGNTLSRIGLWNFLRRLRRGRLASDECYLLLAAVLPEHRGAGVGGRLFDELCSRLRRRGIGRLSLHCGEANQSARRFYPSLGFRTEGLEECGGFLRPRLRYYRMVKNLE